MSRSKIKYTPRHILVFIFDSFFNPHSQIFSGVWKEASTSVNTFREVSNFWKKNPKYRLPRPSATENQQRSRLILALVCTPSPCSHSSWIESSQLECRQSHLGSFISCNSRSSISLNTLGESVRPAWENFNKIFFYVHVTGCLILSPFMHILSHMYFYYTLTSVLKAYCIIYSAHILSFKPVI